MSPAWHSAVLPAAKDGMVEKGTISRVPTVGVQLVKCVKLPAGRNQSMIVG